MSSRYIVFDTNYINMILKNKDKYQEILNELKKDYKFSINITTFVEITQQKINNKERIYDLINFLNKNEFYVGEFNMNKCIKYKDFSFNKLKLECKKDRKKYFQPIRNDFYDFLCGFVSVYAEWIIYSLIILLSENLKNNLQYKTYLNKRSKEYKKEFKKLYEKKGARIKDRFNEIIYRELKKAKNNSLIQDKVLLQQIITAFENNTENLMYVFHADSRVTKETRSKFVEYFFLTEMKQFIQERFNNKIFEEYIKSIFEKLIIGCGKLNPNDIADALILASVNTKDNILLTNDKKIIKFLKSNGMYCEKIYEKLKN